MKIGTRVKVKLKHLRKGKDEAENWSKKDGLKLNVIYTVDDLSWNNWYSFKGKTFAHDPSKFEIVSDKTPLTIQFIPRTRKGVKYFQIKITKQGKVFNHQYNSKQGAKKSFESLVNDLKNGNFIVK